MSILDEGMTLDEARAEAQLVPRDAATAILGTHVRMREQESQGDVAAACLALFRPTEGWLALPFWGRGWADDSQASALNSARRVSADLQSLAQHGLEDLHDHIVTLRSMLDQLAAPSEQSTEQITRLSLAIARKSEELLARLPTLSHRIAAQLQDVKHLTQEIVSEHQHVNQESRATRGPGLPASPIVHRCSPKALQLLLTLWTMEQRTTPRENHIHLVLLASTLLESEMGRLLAEPARSILPAILDAQRTRNPRYNIRVLEDWVERNRPTSLGIEIMILCGLRWGIQQGKSRILDFVESRFDKRYVRIVSDKRLTAALNDIRVQYRNPAHHGEKAMFGRRDFAELSRLITGNASFGGWLKCPGSVKTPDRAILHNHLYLQRAPDALVL